MKVAEKRWGEITIKEQGEKKNQFDKTTSFSVVQTKYPYDIEELREILKISINLTEIFDFKNLKIRLIKISEK